MKRLMSVFFLAMLVIAPALASDTGTDKVTAALMQTEQRLLDSLLKGDSAPFKTAMADSFVFIAPDGSMQQRAEWLTDLETGNLKLTSSVYDNMVVRLYGDAAVVTYGSTDAGKYKDEDISGKYLWTDVFVKQRGQWRIVSTQGTPIH